MIGVGANIHASFLVSFCSFARSFARPSVRPFFCLFCCPRRRLGWGTGGERFPPSLFPVPVFCCRWGFSPHPSVLPRVCSFVRCFFALTVGSRSQINQAVVKRLGSFNSLSSVSDPCATRFILLLGISLKTNAFE